MEQVPHSPQLYGSPGHTPQWLSRPGALCLVPPALWPWCGAQTPSLHGESSRVFIFLPNVRCWTWVHIWQDYLCSSVSMYPFYPLLWSCYSSSFQVFFRGNYSTCRYRFFLFVQKKRQGQDLLRLPWTASSWTFLIQWFYQLESFFKASSLGHI